MSVTQNDNWDHFIKPKSIFNDRISSIVMEIVERIEIPLHSQKLIIDSISQTVNLAACYL